MWIGSYVLATLKLRRAARKNFVSSAVPPFPSLLRVGAHLVFILGRTVAIVSSSRAVEVKVARKQTSPASEKKSVEDPSGSQPVWAGPPPHPPAPSLSSSQTLPTNPKTSRQRHRNLLEQAEAKNPSSPPPLHGLRLRVAPAKCPSRTCTTRRSLLQLSKQKSQLLRSNLKLSASPRSRTTSPLASMSISTSSKPFVPLPPHSSLLLLPANRTSSERTT